MPTSTPRLPLPPAPPRQAVGSRRLLLAFLLLGVGTLRQPRSSAQTPDGAPPADAPPPPVTFQGLIPGVSTIEDVKARLGEPAHQATWYALKLLFPSRTRPGHFDSIHIQGGRRIGSIEAVTIPEGCETFVAVREQLGPPELLLEFSTQSLADYSERGARFTFDARGKTIGAAFFPHGSPRVHEGERSELSLRSLPQGPQPLPVIDSEANTAVPDDDGGELLAGAAQAEITPEKGWLGPTEFTIHDPLRVRAAVFSRFDVSVAIVGGDIFGLQALDVAPIAARLREAGIVDDLILGMSHVHSAGDPIGIYGYYPKEYVAKIQAGVEAAVREAAKKARRVSELRGASAELPLDGARVEGLFRNARNPGIVDPQIAAIEAIGADGKPIVTIAHFACHPEGIATEKGKPLEVSADYPGYLCDALEASRGCQAVFLNGALGGMVSGDTRARTHEEAKGMGLRLAGEIVGVLKTAIPLPRALLVDRHRVEIPVSNPKLIAFELSTGRKASYQGRHITEMYYVRLGSAELLTVPGELLPEVSFEILERMHGYPRMIVGLANDEIGYIIPPYDFRASEYEESMSLGPAAAPVVLRHALRLLED